MMNKRFYIAAAFLYIGAAFLYASIGACCAHLLASRSPMLHGVFCAGVAWVFVFVTALCVFSMCRAAGSKA